MLDPRTSRRSASRYRADTRMSVVVWTDGSADNRSGHGGWAAIVLTPTTVTELAGFALQTTSNRMELMAAIEGLRSVAIPSDIELVSDSSYLVNTLKRQWYLGWFEETPAQQDRRPNMDLWHQLVGLKHYHEIKFRKVKGHSGNYWNERADRLACDARKKRFSRRETFSANSTA